MHLNPTTAPRGSLPLHFAATELIVICSPVSDTPRLCNFLSVLTEQRRHTLLAVGTTIPPTHTGWHTHKRGMLTHASIFGGMRKRSRAVPFPAPPPTRRRARACPKVTAAAGPRPSFAPTTAYLHTPHCVAAALRRVARSRGTITQSIYVSVHLPITIVRPSHSGRAGRSLRIPRRRMLCHLTG